MLQNYVSGYFTTIAAIILFSGVRLLHQIVESILARSIASDVVLISSLKETNIEQAEEKNHIG